MPDAQTALARDRELREELGISPALAGAATYEGLPVLTRHLWEGAPIGLASYLMSGKQIEAPANTPLKRLAEFTGDEIRAIQNFARDSGVNVPILSTKGLRAGGAFVDPDTPLSLIKQRIGKLLGESVPRSPRPFIALRTASVPAAMHEIGHATPVLGSTALRRIVHDVAGGMGHRGLAGNLARIALAGHTLAPPGEDASGKHRFIYEHAPALVGATMLPELAEEARASYHALRGAKKYGPGTLSALKELAPAFGTYAAAAAAPVIATIVAKKLVQALHRKDEEKTAVAKPGTEVKASGRLRSTMSSAKWLGTPYAKPKTTKPNQNPTARADETPKLRPPSKTAYFRDQLESMADPQRGFRIATLG